jgi:hypothetical protein
MEGAGDKEGQLGCAGVSSLKEAEPLEDFLLAFTDFPFLLPNKFIMTAPPCSTGVELGCLCLSGKYHFYVRAQLDSVQDNPDISCC